MVFMVPKRRFSTALRESTRREIERIGEVDIVVGIPSYFSETSIGYVMETIAKGLDKYFRECRSLIYVSEGCSTDDTREIANSVDLSDYNVSKIVATYRGLPGKGTALRAVFEAAEFLRADAIAVFDSDLKSITPEWIKNMISPVYKGYDFVAPYYNRYKFDATITNTIAYNLTRALYGKRIRQPIGGDFAISPRLVKHFLDQDVWETDVAKFGIDIWMTTNAMMCGCNMCQARLGAKIHGEKDPAEDLSAMFREVVGTIYNLMEQYEDFWKGIEHSEEVPIVGKDIGIEPEPFAISQEPLIEYFRIGYKNFSGVWEDILEEEDYKFIDELMKIEKKEDIKVPIEWWVRVVYRYASAFHATPMQKYKLLNTMVPLYNIRVASLINELIDKTTEESEEYFEKQAQVFEDMKGYLIEIW